MQDEKKTDPPGSASGEAPQPLVTRVIEAVIDDAADIAKAIAIGAVVRAGQKAKKIEVVKTAVAFVKKAEGLPSKKTTKRAAAKKAPAKKAAAKKSTTGSKKSAAKKAPAKATKSVSKKSKATGKPGAR
jgi:ribonuclease E